MNSATILIKTDPKLKAKAQKAAKAMDLSLSAVINNLLKKFITTNSITFRNEREEIPNKSLIRIMKQADKDRKAGKASPVFDTAEEAIKWLNI